MTTHKEFYYILTFNTTTDAMCADKCAKENTNGIHFVSWTIIWRQF